MKTKLHAVTKLIKNAREQFDRDILKSNDEALYLYIELGVIYELITNENHKKMLEEHKNNS
jgi:hypothetical protein